MVQTLAPLFWEPDKDSQAVWEKGALLVGSAFTLIASPCFIMYCVVQWMRLDWPRRPARRARFLNMNMRLVVALHLSCILSVMTSVVNVFTPTNDGLLCTVQGMLHQYADCVMTNYNLAVAVWLFLYVFFGKMIQPLDWRTQIGMEVATHVLCLLDGLFWLVLPLSTAAWHGVVYGLADKWCWMREDEMAQFWRIAGFYAPLWAKIAVIVVLYLSCLIFVFRSYYGLYRHEMRARRRRSGLISKFSHQMFLVARSEDSDQSLVRISGEWKTYMKLVLFPGIFLFVIIFPSANRITEFFGTPVFIARLLHRIIVTQQGLLFVLTYPLNPVKLLLWLRRLFLCHPCRKKRKKDKFVIDASLEEEAEQQEDLIAHFRAETSIEMEDAAEGVDYDAM